MRQATDGFTLLELLIVIGIIGVLSAVLIPNLLSARERAFDVGAQTCLKEVGTRQEVVKADFPFEYDSAFDPATIAVCGDVSFSVQSVTDEDYVYEASHVRGRSLYRVQAGTPVTRVGP